MAGITRYERAVLGAAAAFLLFTGGWFLGKQNQSVPYQVTTAKQEQQDTAVQPEQSEPQKPDSLLEGERINLNEADLYDLQRLPGIGEKRAGDILAYRQENGPFESVEELTQVNGIGEGILEELRDYVTVETEES